MKMNVGLWNRPAASRYVALLAALLSPTLSHAALATIELPASAVVNSPAVRLGQVAKLWSSDLQLIQRLVTLPLGAVSSSGDATVLQRSMLERWIRSQVGLRSDQIQWDGEDVTRIQVNKERVSSQAIVDTAENALKHWLASRSERFGVDLVWSPRETWTVVGPVRLVSRPIAYERPFRRMQVWVDLVANNGVMRSVPVSFDVKAYGQAAVVDRDSAAGTSASQVLSAREVDLTSLRTAPRKMSDSSAQDYASLRLRRSLRAGEAVLATDLETTPAVQRGDRVKLLVASGGMTIESWAEVMQDAQIGQAVRVKTASSGKTIGARVAGVGIVELTQ